MLKNVSDIMTRIRTIQKRFGLIQQNPAKKTSFDSVQKKVMNKVDPLQNQQISKINKRASEISQTYGVPPKLVQSIIQKSSNYDPNAMSKDGRLGLMQLLPSITKSLGVKNTLSVDGNLTAGVSILKKYLTKYNGDYVKALAAFNTGDKIDGALKNGKTKENINNILNAYKQNSLEIK
jgi:soluble lytic murein transglycosylase-like protein